MLLLLNSHKCSCNDIDIWYIDISKFSFWGLIFLLLNSNAGTKKSWDRSTYRVIDSEPISKHNTLSCMILCKYAVPAIKMLFQTLKHTYIDHNNTNITTIINYCWMVYLLPLKSLSFYTYLHTYLLNIDIDIAMFRHYRIDIVSKSKQQYRSITVVFMQ